MIVAGLNLSLKDKFFGFGLAARGLGLELEN